MNGFRSFVIFALICIVIGYMYTHCDAKQPTECNLGPGWNETCK
jgi:hypothetical protein